MNNNSVATDSKFSGILINKDEQGYHASLQQIDDSVLPEGDVTIKVLYSTLNYKDGLAITGKSPVVRQFPLVPGIDLVGVVEHSDSADFKASHDHRDCRLHRHAKCFGLREERGHPR